MRALVWFRSDLRVDDNLALHHAARTAKRGVLGIFFICPRQWAEHDWGAVKVEYILRNLRELSAALEKRNIPLLIRTVPTFAGIPDALADVIHEHDVDALFFNHEYEVNEKRRDEAVCSRVDDLGRQSRSFTDQVALPPGDVRTQQGDFYTVFTPYRKRWATRIEAEGLPTCVATPKKQAELICTPDDIPESIEGFGDSGVDPSLWPGGEADAKKRLKHFVQTHIGQYEMKRDFPAEAATSALSPALAAGTISIRRCMHAALDANDGRLDEWKSGPGTWLSELIWREFYRHILVGHPTVCMNQPFQRKTRHLTWRDSETDFNAWCQGLTGIPIVDAAMRALAATGWMHNRLRMIVAMFLTKQLLIDWRRGERWFMEHLVDGDFASNNGGWQWAASTGTDAAPYFRIFNPIRQSERFDPDGAFIRRYIPELKDVTGKSIHDPSASASLFDNTEYPEPIVDLAEGRDRAIAAFKALPSPG